MLFYPSLTLPLERGGDLIFLFPTNTSGGLRAVYQMLFYPSLTLPLERGGDLIFLFPTNISGGLRAVYQMLFYPSLTLKFSIYLLSTAILRELHKKMNCLQQR